MTAANYGEKSLDYARKRGQCTMLYPDVHEEQLRAWRMYFTYKGDAMRHRAVTMLLNEKGTYATPADWPWEFDGEYKP